MNSDDSEVSYKDSNRRSDVESPKMTVNARPANAPNPSKNTTPLFLLQFGDHGVDGRGRWRSQGLSETVNFILERNLNLRVNGR